jgi:hypothetical protein
MKAYKFETSVFGGRQTLKVKSGDGWIDATEEDAEEMLREYEALSMYKEAISEFINSKTKES